MKCSKISHFQKVNLQMAEYLSYHGKYLIFQWTFSKILLFLMEKSFIKLNSLITKKQQLIQSDQKNQNFLQQIYPLIIQNNKSMFIRTFLLIAILLFALLTETNQQCHYSCLNCTASFYTNCFACLDSSDNLTILENPDNIDPLYRNSIYPSGACTGKVPQGINGLGVLLLMVSIGGIIFTQSFQAFFIVSTFQTLALFGLLEVAWINPSSYILQAFQYFMPINLILKNLKHDDSKLFVFGFYRLDEYMVSSEDIGLIGVFIVDCIIFLTILTLFIITLHRRKKQTAQTQIQQQSQQIQQNNLIPQFSNQSQHFDQVSSTMKRQEKPIKNRGETISPQQQSKTQRCTSYICQKASQCLILRKIMHILIYVFFFFCQQTSLSIMVGAVFTIDKLDIAIWAIYFLEVIAVIIISVYEYYVDQQMYKEDDKNQYGLSLFVSRDSMFLILVKKLLLPLGVVIPPENQFLFFVMYLVLFLIQGTLDSRSPRITCFSRMNLWKLIELCLTTLILSFFFNQKKGAQAGSAIGINSILTICFLAFLASLVVQMVFSTIFILFGSKKVDNDLESTPVRNQKQLQVNNTEMTINEGEKVDDNIFETVEMERENTRENIDQRKFSSSFSPESPVIEANKVPAIVPIANQKKENKKQIKIADFQEEMNDEIVNQRNREALIVSKAKINKPEITPQKGQPQQKPTNDKSTKPQNDSSAQKSSKQKQAPKQVIKQQSKLIEQPKPIQQPKTIPVFQAPVRQPVKQIDHYQIQPRVNQSHQHDDENQNHQEDQQEQTRKDQKKKPKRRILDPELRKRYGMK